MLLHKAGFPARATSVSVLPHAAPIHKAFKSSFILSAKTFHRPTYGDTPPKSEQPLWSSRHGDSVPDFVQRYWNSRNSSRSDSEVNHNYCSWTPLGTIHEVGTAKSIAERLRKCPDTIFPMRVCGSFANVGDIASLWPFETKGGCLEKIIKVKIEGADDISVTLRAVKGKHPLRGTATHALLEDDGHAWWVVVGHGPEGEEECLIRQFINSKFNWESLIERRAKPALTLHEVKQ